MDEEEGHDPLREVLSIGISIVISWHVNMYFFSLYIIQQLHSKGFLCTNTGLTVEPFHRLSRY